MMSIYDSITFLLRHFCNFKIDSATSKLKLRPSLELKVLFLRWMKAVVVVVAAVVAAAAVVAVSTVHLPRHQNFLVLSLTLFQLQSCWC